jgi:hypothetical protein
MATKKTSSATQKENYKRYATEQKWKKNKELQLKRHTKKFPNDKQAEKALTKLAEKAAPTGPRKPGNERGNIKTVPPQMVVVHMPLTVAEQLAKLGYVTRGRR